SGIHGACPVGRTPASGGWRLYCARAEPLSWRVGGRPGAHPAGAECHPVVLYVIGIWYRGFWVSDHERIPGGPDGPLVRISAASRKAEVEADTVRLGSGTFLSY